MELEPTCFIDKDCDQSKIICDILQKHVQSMNKEEVSGVVENLEHGWGLKFTNFQDARELGYHQFLHENCFDVDGNPDPSKIDIPMMRDNYTKQLRFVQDVYYHIKLNIENDKNDDEEFSLLKRVNNIIKQIENGFENVRRHYNSYELVTNPTAVPLTNSLSDPSTLGEDDIESATPFQQCLLFTLDEIYKNGYRRYKGYCCEEIKTVEGYRTRAWKQIHTIEHFVHTLARKNNNFKMWKNFTSRGSTVRDVVDNISKCVDHQFPEIHKRRHVWSFRNGVFVGKQFNADTDQYECRFYPYESKEFMCLDPTIVACKYFDQSFNHFPDIQDWKKIPTPYFDSVLKYQKFEDDVCDWAYAMGGRLCFDINEMDGWQVIPFFKGIARSGKSTLITKVFKKFYENEDVGTLSNNIEKKFGLSAIKDSFMFIAPEVKGDLALEQAEFQSIVSGEDVSVAVKNKTAVSIEWTVPGVLGGNEVPNWKDNSGSVLRRILPWNFGKQVREADPLLDKKLDKELPVILYKCVWAYLDFCKKYSDQDIWNVVPEYFKKIQKQVAMVASVLHHYLESTGIEFGTGLFVPQKLFVSSFNQHCVANNLGKHKFNADFYNGPFSSRNIEVRDETVTYKGRVYPRQPVIYGLDIISDEAIDFTDNF